MRLAREAGRQQYSAVRWVQWAVGATALSGGLVACAAISGLDGYSTDECSSGCDGLGDASVPADAPVVRRDASDATSPPVMEGAVEAEGGTGEGGPNDDADDGGCSTGLIACDAGCVSLTTTQNCGLCGVACSTAQPNAAATCTDGRCTVQCVEGFSMCNGDCVQYTNAANCGGCGSACDGDAAPLCAATDAGAYSCVPACPDQTPTLCGDSCVDTTSDRDNCNACGNVCPNTVDHAQAVCVHGACTFACASGYQECNGACVQYTTAANCGSCGNACSGDGGAAVCAGSNGSYACVSGCPPGAPTLCAGSCVDTTNDVNNCNACGAACTSSVTNSQPACEDGGCTFSCSAGTNLCDGACIQFTTASNCGACGVACSPEGGTPLCAGSPDAGAYSCVSGCPPSASTRCGGACVDTTGDKSNCGACGVVCSTSVANAQPTCVGGACTFTCNSGFTLCNGACADVANDPNNCGGCGSTHACGGGMTCQAGQCTMTCTITSNCPPGYACNGTRCTTSCSQTQPCNGGCCANGTCVAGTTTATACGINGGACTNCTAQGNNRACANGLCGCNAASDCSSLNACSLAIHSCQQLCGGANTGCNGGCCTNMMTGGQCVQGNVDGQCGATGGQCENCQTACGPGPHCINDVCGCNNSLDCVATSACGSRQTCTSGSCQ